MRLQKESHLFMYTLKINVLLINIPLFLMRVEESNYKDLYTKKVTIKSGDFYFFEKFIISEISEGVHFTWEIAKEIIALAYEHYGQDVRVAYISNRVNSYSVNAQDWLNFYKERHHLEAIAIIAYDKLGIMNVVLEKLFTQTRLRKFKNLDEAVAWISTLNNSSEIEKAS